MANFTSKNTGLWDAEGQITWNEAGHPGATDDVTIQNGHTVTLDSAASCYKLVINGGGVLTDATNNVGLTAVYYARITGTLTCGTAAMSFGSGQVNLVAKLRIDAGGVFNGGSGNHTCGSIESITATSTLNMTSGICTIDAADGGRSLNISAVSTFAHNNGRITQTYKGEFYVETHSLYNLTINQTVSVGDSHLFTALTIANDLNILLGTIECDADGAGSHNLTVSGYTSITGTLDGKAATITHTKNVTINAGGAYELSSGTTSFTNDITNNGTFTHNNGTVVMNGSDQSLIGSITFWHFTKSVTVARELKFTAGDTYTFGGNVTLNGISGNLLTVKSLSTGSSFNFVMNAGAVKTNLSYLSVKDSDASASAAAHKPIAPTNSTDVSGNTDWFAGGGGGSASLLLCV